MSRQPLGVYTPKYNTVYNAVSEDTEHSIPGLKALGHALPRGLRIRKTACTVLDLIDLPRDLSDSCILIGIRATGELIAQPGFPALCCRGCNGTAQWPVSP